MTDGGGSDRAGSDRRATPEQLPEARRCRSRWAGWFWAIPLAALALVGWLAAREWLLESGDVTVVFARAEGLSPGASVQYRGANVGRVKDIRLADNLAHVKVVLNMEGPITDHIGAGTLFWIERPGLAQGQIKNLIAGSHVGVQPADGEPQRVFDGLEEPPVMPAYQPGRRFVLTATDAGGLSAGSSVLFRGVEVGRVLGTRLDETNGLVEVPIVVDQKHADLVHQASAFWRAGGVSISMASGIDIDLPSLQSLISGAIAFDTPEVFAGPAARPEAVFPLYDSRDAAKAVPGGPVFPYFVQFPQAVGGLARGAPVTLQGRRIGHVARVRFDTDPGTGNFATPVEITIDAVALGIQTDGVKTREELRDRLDQMIAKLVEDGLRAKIASGGFLSSGPAIDLAIVSGAPPAALDRQHDPPAIPATAAGPEKGD
jgi:paraquat-inducible protein B